MREMKNRQKKENMGDLHRKAILREVGIIEQICTRILSPPRNHKVLSFLLEEDTACLGFLATP